MPSSRQILSANAEGRASAPLISMVAAAALWLIPLLHSPLTDRWSAHDFSRLAQLLLLAAVALCWMRERWLRHAPGLPGEAPARLALMALIALSTALCASTEAALRELLIFIGLLVLAAVSANEMRTGHWHWPMRVMAFGTLAYGLLVVAMAGLVLSSGEAIAGWELLAGFDNPRFLNHAQTVAIPLTAAVALQPGASRGMRAVAWGALLVSGALLFICQGRATVLGLLSGVFAAVLMLRGRASLRYALVLLLPLMAGALGMGLLWQLAPQTVGGGGVVNTDGLTTGHSRGYLIALGLDMVRAQPWLGVGPMHYAHVLNAKAAHPHNVYVQFLAEFGIPATLLAAALCVRVMRRWLRTLRNVPEPHKPFAAALWTALIGVLVDALFSGNFVMPISQLWIAMLLGLLMAVHRRYDDAGTARPSASPSAMTIVIARLAPLLLTAAILWLAVQSFREAWSTDRPSLPSAPESVRSILAPRFWSHGWF